MNIQLAETEEFVDMKSTGGLGQVLIRYVGARSVATEYFFESTRIRGIRDRRQEEEVGKREESTGLTRDIGVITSSGYQLLLTPMVARGRRWKNRRKKRH